MRIPPREAPSRRRTLGDEKSLGSHDYAAICFAGGHGVIWDFPENGPLQAISRRIHEGGGVVSSACHGAVACANGRRRACAVAAAWWIGAICV